MKSGVVRVDEAVSYWKDIIIVEESENEKVKKF